MSMLSKSLKTQVSSAMVMPEVNETATKIRRKAQIMAPYVIMFFMIMTIVMQLTGSFAFAAGDGNSSSGGGGASNNAAKTKDAFTKLYGVVKIITTVIGAIFLLVGIVRFVIAHANEDGPSQQKAAMFIATGIALIAIGPVMSALHLEDLIETSIT